MITNAPVLAVARQQYVQRQLLARRAVLQTRKAWSQLDPDQIRLSWRVSVGSVVQDIVTGAQLEAASSANTNADAVLAAQGITFAPVGLVDAAAFAGVASDGRNLASLLELSNLYALRAIAVGQTPKQALTLGGNWLERVVGTQVVDAGRVAAGVAVTAQTTVNGYYRVLSSSACDRCAVLAGVFYRWNAGFLRHPNCHCTQVAGEQDSPPAGLKTPQQYFDSLTKAQQDATFTKASAAAIRDGADIAQVVNARPGMYTAASGRKLTRAAARLYGSRGVRLMPEQIYRDAHGSREEAIRLLTRFGYIR